MLKFKVKNMMIIVLLTVICALVLSMFVGNIRYTAKAETAEEIAKQMTESDEWYDDNMVKHNIQDYAEELVQSSGAANRDIFKIIPIEYLRTTNEEKAYSYMGKEYGFYVRHRKVIPASITGQTLDPVYVLDILLIDFYYEDLHSQASFKIQVIPLFSETFFYNNNDGEESLS